MTHWGLTDRSPRSVAARGLIFAVESLDYTYPLPKPRGGIHLVRYLAPQNAEKDAHELSGLRVGKGAEGARISWLGSVIYSSEQSS